MTLITWDGDDWSNPDSQNNTTVQNGNLALALFEDGFEEYPTGQFPPSPWEHLSANVEVVDNRSYGGDQSLHVDANQHSSDSARAVLDPGEYNVFQYIYRETSGNQETTVFIRDENGNLIFYSGTDNPQVFVTDDGTYTEIANPQSDDYNEWRRFTFTLNWDNGTYDVLWEDLTGGVSDTTGTFNMDSTNPASQIIIGMYSSGNNHDIWFDNFALLSGSGNLITGSQLS